MCWLSDDLSQRWSLNYLLTSVIMRSVEKLKEELKMTDNERTLKEENLNTEELEQVAGGIRGDYCPRCGSPRINFGKSTCSCTACSAVWQMSILPSGTSYYMNMGNVKCPSCGSKNLEFMIRSTDTVKYECKSCQKSFGLRGGFYC